MVNKNLLLVFVVVMTMGVFNLAVAAPCPDSVIAERKVTQLTSAVDMFLMRIEGGLRGDPVTDKEMKSSFADIVSAVRSELRENSK